MATQTPYFGLTKSGGTEAALIGVYNNNMDIIDLEIWQSMVRAAINLAPIYNETAAYVEGSYCTLLETVQQTVTGFHLYKCTTDTTDPAGTFDPNSWSEVDITSEMGHGGGGGGGHIYLDNSGNVMTQRTKAKFEGAYTTDNGTNDITNVAVMRTMKAMEYAQLTEAEKQGIIFVDDETGAVEDKFQPVIYSLEEREIGVWTDGKPLYEKTIAVTAPSSDETTINHNISNADYIYVKEGTLTKTGNGTTPYETYHSSSAWACGVYNVSRTSFTLFVGSSLRQFVNGGFITFRYTKSTDTAGSGQWTPQGVPAVHYSTDEKVVGTWIDGSTIYEITTDMGSAGVSINAGASKDSNIPIGNIEKITYSQAISQSGKYFPVIGAELGGSYVQMINMGSSTRNVRWFTIQYTKSS